MEQKIEECLTLDIQKEKLVYAIMAKLRKQKTVKRVFAKMAIVYSTEQLDFFIQYKT